MTTNTTSADHSQVNVQAGENTVLTMQLGQSLTLASNAVEVQGMTMDKSGALLVQFSDGASVTIKNFQEAASCSTGCTLTLPSGQAIALAELAHTLAPQALDQVADNSATAQMKEAISVVHTDKAPTDADVHLIKMPNAKEELVVKLQPGDEYKFAFAMTEPTGVHNNNGELVITFKNGGEIIIPNYDSVKDASMPDFIMKDGTKLAVNDFSDVLNTASQLNAVEPAAGGNGGGGGAGGGFGFNSVFTSTALDSINPIGPIDRTQLQYGVPFAEPKPFIQAEDDPLRAPTLSTVNIVVKEDSTAAHPSTPFDPATPHVTNTLDITATLNSPHAGDVLTITVSGISAGWTVDTSVSGGTYDAASGTWTLTLPAGVTSFHGGPDVYPPANSDGDLTGLSVSATVTRGADSQTATGSETVITDAVVDPVGINAPDHATGTESHPVALNITLTPSADQDGSEHAGKITISGLHLADGTVLTLNHGTDNGDGTWTLTEADLTGLTVSAPAYYHADDIKLQVSITETEDNLLHQEVEYGDNTATTTTSISVSFTDTIEQPSLKVQNVWIKEDSDYAHSDDNHNTLKIDAALNNPGPGDHLVITVTGIEPGWTVDIPHSGGVFDAATGTWTLTLDPGQDYHGGIVLVPPADSDADLSNLTVTATATDGSVHADTSTAAAVYTDAVIDAPSLTTADASGNEDTTIALNISVSKGGDSTDGSEVLSPVTIAGMPAGATLNHGHDNGDGTWTLTTGDLSGLTITPAHNYNGDITLTVSVTDTETNLSGLENDTTDNSATATGTIVVHVAPVSDDPTCDAHDAQVKEDGSVQLVVDAGLAPGAFATDYLVVTITGITAGWGVDTSTSGGTYNAATGTWTLKVPAGTDFHGGPTFSPPHDSDVDLTGLTVTTTQYDSTNTAVGSATDHAGIVVDAVIDAPSLDVHNANGNEDTAIALNIGVSKGGDSTDGSEVLSPITIGGVPAGATLNHGHDNGDGTWTLTPADLTGLTITPAHNYNGSFDLTVSVTDTETNLSGGEYDTTDNSATATGTVHVTVNPVDDNPTCDVHDAQVKEDGSVQLVVDSSPAAGSTPTDYLVITITGITTGWGVDTSTSGGTYDAKTGTWTLTVPAGSDFHGGPTFSPPHDSDVDLTGLHVTSTQYDHDGNVLGSATDTGSIVVDAVIDAPTITSPDAQGNEDTAIPLTINVSKGGDSTDGSEVLSPVTIAGIPAGATLNHGHDNGDGTWTLTTGDLSGLTITPPHNYSGTFDISVSVTDTETNLSGGEYDTTDNSATATDIIHVTVNPVADAPTLCVADQWVKEDGSVKLSIQANLTDTDGSEHLTVTIAGIGAGWGVDTSKSGGTYDAAHGTWTITLPPGVNFDGGPTLSPPANSDADLTGLTVTATSTEGANGSAATTTGIVNVYTDAVVDHITVSASATSGHNNSDIPLTITIGASADKDGSEGVTKVVISGVPTGASLNHGHDNGDGTWTLTQSELNGLTYHAASTSSGTVKLTVAVTEQETNLSGQENDLTDNTYVATTTLNVGVTCDPNPPSLCVNDVWVKEDHSVQLNVQASLDHPQSSAEHLVITITGIQAGWAVDTSASGGTYNAATGTWTVSLPAGASFNGGPTLTPPANSDADLTGLHVTAVATDGTYSATTNGTENVFVDAVVDAITVTASAASGHNNTDIPLTINIGASADKDGSEGVTKIVISGVPTGASLNHGHNNGDGTWTLSSSDLNGLTYHAASTSSGTVKLTVAVTEQETVLSGQENDLTDNTYVATTTLNVGVTCDPNPPTLCVTDVWTYEDKSVALNVQASLDHPQSTSEHLVITISGIAAGWTVDTSKSGGTYDAAHGTWTITLPNGASYNGGPTLTPPANSDADLTGLHVTAVATDGTYSATTNGTENVFVDAVVDAITVTASAASGHTHTDIPLTITIGASADKDGSEGVTKVVISGVPTGASLNHGHNNGDGTWTLTQGDLNGLTFHPADSSASNVQLTVAVTEQETVLSGQELTTNNNTYVATTTINVGVTCDPNPPVLCVSDVWVKEDHSVQLNVQATLDHPQTKEFLVVTISGIAAGWTVDTSHSGGTYDAAHGTWTITLPPGVNFDGGPTLTPPTDSDVDLTGLKVTATSTDGTYSSTTNGTENVFVDAVVDPITIAAHDTTGREGTAIALTITIGQSHDHTDGSEGVTKVVISGVPADAILNHGVHNTDGTWTLSQADLTGLTITPAVGYMGAINLTIAATEQETKLSGSENDYTDNTYVATTHLGVDVYCDPHPPSLCVYDVWVKEDSSKGVALNIQASLDNPHVGEHLVITVSGFQAGWTVDTSKSGGTYDAAHGVWTITLPEGASFNGGPTVFAPANSDVDMDNLHIVATATDGVASASTFGIENVYVDAVVDTPVLTVPASVNYLWIIDQSNPSPLAISSHVTDTDGSEKISKIVINLNNAFTNPVTGYNDLDDAGVYLNKGTETSPGIWTINVNAQDASTALNGLALMTPTSENYYWALHNGPHSGTITVQSYVTDGTPGSAEYDLNDNTTVVTQNISYTFSVSPLVIDLNGDGFNLVNQSAGVKFDMTNDGHADATSWVAATDGFLAIDTNHDGVINNQSELFGDTATKVDGFANLAQYDTNHDGVINANDAAFKDLVIWQDTNQNGVSDAGELHHLGDYGIDSISLTTTAVNQTIGDSTVTTVSTVTYADGHTTQAGDAWFNVADATDHTGVTVDGTAANDIMYGTAKNDHLSGGDGFNQLYGGDGDDILVANGGVNELTGGTGADTFLIQHAAGQNVDTIKDFNVAEGDKLDISDVLTNFDPLTSSLHNFVNVVQEGGNSIVQIDQTGTGHAFQNVVVLEGVSIDIDTLAQHGNLIA
ncbi:MAG: type I secretion C-terminal target domain-containing protein [Micavibrio sp.]|nr:type I secretion C-terminal target domain-containing protein [Micavibrio sp.]